MLRMRGVNDYEWLLIGGWTTRSMGVVITEMENIELRVEIFLLLFSDLYLRAEGITEFYLGYIKCEIFINPSGDVKKENRQMFKFETQWPCYRQKFSCYGCIYVDLKLNNWIETSSEIMWRRRVA